MLTSSSRLVVCRAIRSTCRSLSTTITTEQREVERAEKRARRKAIEDKRKAVEAYVASIGKPQSAQQPIRKDETKGQAWRDWERSELAKEAGIMARSLYRNCLRSVEILRPGNEHDEKDFLEREEAQFSEKPSSDGVFSMAAPVDRENELWSRAQYYYSHLRENFDSDSQCLEPAVWKFENAEQYLAFLRRGEMRRKYVLKDYQFEDPFDGRFDLPRTNAWEKRVEVLIRDSYKANGWIIESDLSPEDYVSEDDDEDEFDPDFDKGRPPEGFWYHK